MSFINPIPNSYLTSPFGWRTHPVTGQKQSWHQGVDLARQPNTNVEVLAAADGEVIRVGALGTYGNVVMIKHSINGKRMDTNYAHLKDGSILVKVGQRIKQGQRIATMGNTGSSTAPHLHFEIHNGAWATGQPNAVDPAKYIKFYTKGELAKMEQRIKELEEEVRAINKTLSTFQAANKYEKDAIADEWAKDDIQTAKDLNITDGTFLKRPITRQEAIVLVVRGIKHIKEWVKSFLKA